MHQETLKEIVAELSGALTGRFLGKLFQLSASSLAVDFGVRTAGWLFMSVEPAAPRLYLIKRSVRELEKQSQQLTPFAQSVRAAIGGARLDSVTKLPTERIVTLRFSAEDELGETETRSLVVQLTGRSANLLLLDANGIITKTLRPPKGVGQQIGEHYAPPSLQKEPAGSAFQLERGKYSTISEAADSHYANLEARQDFDALATSLAAQVRKEIRKLKKLRANLKADLDAHGDPEQHKRLGDLILANLAHAKRRGNEVSLQDFYQEGAPTIVVEIDEHISLQDSANEYFSRYGKAKRAIEEIGARLVQIERQLDELETKQAKIEEAIASRDEPALLRLGKVEQKSPDTRKKRKESPPVAGAKRYRSSDGYEILVGRAARDNDNLTFHVARPNDLWLHAGDYPGSHVIVRNSSRKEIPHRTVVEAAQLAAKFSQASKDSKVVIHYTPRKFLSKPKGAAPGLVRMSSFRSITVEPGENVERL